MKIKFLKGAGGIGYAYFAGDTMEASEGLAEELITLGYAKEDKEASVLPLDLPGREAFIEAGMNDLEEIKGLSDYTEIKGIGDATAEKIVAYFNPAE